MSSTVVVFLKGWQLEDELAQLEELSAAGGGLASTPADRWYWVIAGDHDGSQQRVIDRLREQNIHTTQARVFAPKVLRQVNEALADARPLADYLRGELLRQVRREHAQLLVRWRVDWPALATGASSLMAFIAQLSWWHPSEACPSLELPRGTLLGDTLRRSDGGSALQQLIGESPLMKRLRDTLCARAELPYPVLLIGETGSGKELAARVLHEESGRSGRLISVNAALLGPDRMAESELFGHTKGAFTDATKERLGRIREADKGTFFLDELDSLPLATQARLLRALAHVNDARIDVTPMGSEGEPHQVSARFVAALQRNPLDYDDFRRDLYFRIATIPIFIPPLNQRGEDLLEIAAEELARLPQDAAGGDPFRIAADAEQTFVEYTWPGNVRELQRIVLLGYLAAREANRREIRAEDVRPHLVDTKRRSFTGTESLEIQVAKYQLAAGEYALARHPGNKAAAARELGYKTGQDLERMLEVARKKLG